MKKCRKNVQMLFGPNNRGDVVVCLENRNGFFEKRDDISSDEFLKTMTLLFNHILIMG